MKLNLKKCTFGVEEGMFLGYKVNTKGIKVCTDKVDVVLSLPSLKCLKDVQKLNEKLASLNRFLAKSAEKSLPFFKTLKKCQRKVTSTGPKNPTGRLQKWSIELGEYAVHYRPRVFVKGQILADFIVERPEEDDPNNVMDVEEELPEPCTLFTDGSGARLILTSPEGAEFTYALRIAEEIGVKNLQTNVDSRLVASQVNGTYIAKEADMIRYLKKVRTLTNGFRMFSIKQVPRSENKKADALSKIASTSFARLSKQVLVEELKEKSINELEVLAVVEEEGNTWMTPIYEYLTEETLLAEVNKARAVRRKSQR
ncbi:reverse transcriptase domain-containing protein, partial [Tanacetum coccineum]